MPAARVSASACLVGAAAGKLANSHDVSCFPRSGSECSRDSDGGRSCSLPLMLKFPANALPTHLDEFLASLPGEDRPLWMPVKLELGGGIGAAAQAVQAIATWAQASEAKLLQLSPQYGASADTRDRFATSLPGMAALYFANSVEAGQFKQSRYDALRLVAPQVNAMDTGNFRETVRGPGAALVCFAGAKTEFLNPLYVRDEPDAVRGTTDFRLLLSRLLKSTGSGLSERMSETQLDLLGSLVHQLFLNTDQHGAYDASGRRYSSGVRGVAVKHTSIANLGEVIQAAGPDSQLRSYLSKATIPMGESASHRVSDARTPVERAGRPVRLVEVSVFDSGPGMGLRWLAKKQGAANYESFTVDQELEAVLECFDKHATTKAVQNAGVGLHKAVKAMAGLKAFMTLRTGRISLYQDFSVLTPVAFAPKPRSKKSFAVPHIAGTGYSVCFRVD